jgi:hypothetical protein
MDALGGGDPRSLGSGRSRKKLAEEAEMAIAAKAEIQQGNIIFSSLQNVSIERLSRYSAI